MKKKICQYLSKVLLEMSEEELMKTMEIPPEEKMGDLALPCFAMAKKMRKNPMQIATELVEKLNEKKDELGIEKETTMYLLKTEVRQNANRTQVAKGEALSDGKPKKKEPKRVNKVGRNEQCPCGSGKKYKQCCGK